MHRKLRKPISINGLTFHSISTTAYSDGNVAVFLTGESDEGIEKQVVSINIPRQAYKLGEGEFFLKTYSELTDIARQLVENEEVIVSDRKVQTGYTEVPIALLVA